jgi:transcriptional antiterminator RfaH
MTFCDSFTGSRWSGQACWFDFGNLVGGMESCEPQRHQNWLVVMTQPQREKLALEHLNRQNFDTYCPVVLKRVRHARRSMDVQRPLFPGYVFVGFDPDMRWHAVRSTVGTRGLILEGNQPGLLDGAFIDGLRAREVDGVIASTEVQFTQGQSVSLTSGPLADLIGQIVEMRDSERVMILLSIMGQEVKTLVAADKLQINR